MIARTIKHVLIVCTLFFLAGVSHAQDIIVRKDGSEIKAKVLEITSTVVKYRLADFEEGPLYVVNKGEIFRIVYANGVADTLRYEAPVQVYSAPVQQHARIERAGNLYTRNGILLDIPTIHHTIKASANQAAIDELRYEKYTRRFGKLGISIGLPVAGVGLLYVAAGFLTGGARISSDETVIIAFGAAMTIVGTAMAITGFNLYPRSKEHMAKAVELYNAGLARSNP
jgi:hypothetical protein